jgi:hypothetical protein
VEVRAAVDVENLLHVVCLLYRFHRFV